MNINKIGKINYDRALLESAVNSIYATFNGVDLYQSVIEKSARLCYSLIKNHAFHDGNKRIGITAMLALLHLNNYNLNFSQQDIINLGFKCADGTLTYKDICNWINEKLV